MILITSARCVEKRRSGYIKCRFYDKCAELEQTGERLFCERMLPWEGNVGPIAELAEDRREVLYEHFGPGDRLTVDDLAEVMDASRCTARKYLKRLERHGIIERNGNRNKFYLYEVVA